MNTLKAALSAHIAFVRASTDAAIRRMKEDEAALVLAHNNDLEAARQALDEELRYAARLIEAEQEQAKARLDRVLADGAAELAEMAGRIGETLTSQADDCTEIAAARLESYLAEPSSPAEPDKVTADLSASPVASSLPDFAAVAAEQELCAAFTPPTEDGTGGDVEQPNPDHVVEDETAVLVQPHQPEGLDNPNADVSPSLPVGWREDMAEMVNNPVAKQDFVILTNRETGEIVAVPEPAEEPAKPAPKKPKRRK